MTDQQADVRLTPREMDVVRLLCQGITSTAELSEHLVISQHTTHYHLQQIKSKMDVDHVAQIVAYAHLHGVVDTGTLEWRGGSAA